MSNKNEYPLLKTENLSVHYGRAIALASINIEVEKGEVVAVLGPNGAGKTTLMRALSALEELEHGKVFFEGNLILESTKSEFRKLGRNKSLKSHEIVELGIIHCPERRRLFSDSSVEENLLLGAYAIEDQDEIARNFELVMKLFPELSLD